MAILKGLQNLQSPPKNPVITIGNFDGVHLGHQEIIRQTVAEAKTLGGVSVAITFRPHPQIALKPASAPALLTTYDDKLSLLEAYGLDLVIEEPFSREFSTVRPETFFSDVLIKRLGARAIVVGYDFGFGKEREGSLELLRGLCARSGVKLTIVQPHKLEGEVASSSRIRQGLLQGDLASANRLLGREFFYRGVVERGEGRGRKLGFPTANLKLPANVSGQIGDLISLPYGVYAGWTIWKDKRYACVTNIGVRPTFHSSPQALPVVEVHLIDETIDLYGSTLEVRFLTKLRDEKKFAGVAELKTQIAQDVQNAVRILTR